MRNFFFAVKPETKQNAAGPFRRACQSSQASRMRPGRVRSFGDFRCGLRLCFCFPSPPAQGELFGHFHAENEHRLPLLTHSFASCAAWASSAHSLGASLSSLSGCYARGGSNSQRRPPSLFVAAARLYSQRHPPSSVSRQRSRRRPLNLFCAKALFFSGAARIVQARA